MSQNNISASNEDQKKEVYEKKFKKYIGSDSLEELREHIENIFSFKFNLILYPLASIILSFILSILLGFIYSSFWFGFLFFISAIPISIISVGLFGVRITLIDLKESLIFLIKYIVYVSKKTSTTEEVDNLEKLTFKESCILTIKYIILPIVKQVSMFFFWYVPVLFWIKNILIRSHNETAKYSKKIISEDTKDETITEAPTNILFSIILKSFNITFKMITSILLGSGFLTLIIGILLILNLFFSMY